MRRIPALIACIILGAALAAAQEPDTTYSFILSGGGGITKNVSVFQTIPGTLNQMGFSGTVRIMWKPDYVLRAGLETGYTHIYTIDVPYIPTSTGTTDASALLSAVPILATISMPMWDNFELFLGGGVYIVSSHMKLADYTQTESVVSMGRMISLAYSSPLNENLRLGTEVKWLYMDKFQDNNFTLQFMFYYTLSRY